MEKKEIKNIIKGSGTNVVQNIQGHNNSNIQQNVNLGNLDELFKKLKEELENIKDTELREEVQSRIDTLELSKDRPDKSKLSRIADYFRKNYDRLATVASLGLQICQMLMK